MTGYQGTRRGLAAASMAATAALLTASRLRADELRPSFARAEAVAMTINAADFGCKGDGVTDDSTSLNAAINELRKRRSRVANFEIGYRIVLPAGVYALESSLNLTDLRDINTVIEGNGSVLIGRCEGQPAVDALGSRWLTIRDLCIIGDSRAVPSVGLQIGRTSHAVADDHRMSDVKILGHFSLACFYNRAAETSEFDHLLLWNDQPASFCLIQDGMNFFNVQSQFTSTQLAQNADLSFNENLFMSCDFRHSRGGTPIWLGDTARHAFVRCYSATDKGPAFILQVGNNSHTMLEVDCHCETVGLQDVFKVVGQRNKVLIRGLSYRDHHCNASSAVFSLDPAIELARIEDANFSVGSYSYPSCRVFGDPQRWEASGYYASSKADGWNGEGAFSGYVSLAGELRQLGQCGTKSDAGPASRRPSGVSLQVGHLYFDTSIKKLLLWSGDGWITADGLPL